MITSQRPPSCDYEALEVYERHFSEARAFLLAYADILAQTGKPYHIEESPKIREWIEAFDSVSQCHETVLATTNFMIAHSLKQAIGQVAAGNPYTSAFFIIGAVNKPYEPYYNEFIGGN